MACIYFYKLTADNGGAPCTDGGVLLSLAICKPMIRRKAQEGDLIFGFAANSLHGDNRLIYAAVVAENVSGRKYYGDSDYAGRGDRIYKFASGEFVRRRGALHHERPGDLVHDLGAEPEYRKANVLLSTDFRYFGGDGDDEYKSEFRRVRDAVENLGRGHRVLHSPALHRDLLSLKDWIWRLPGNKVAGRPTNAPSGSVCHRSRSSGEV
jgi:hypothetical protein